MSAEIPEDLRGEGYAVEGPGKVIKGEKFRMDAKPFVVGMKDGGEQEEPEISVKKEKDLISSIEVKCLCGRVIHIDCR